VLGNDAPSTRQSPWLKVNLQRCQQR
jgi:hypothetical protein